MTIRKYTSAAAFKAALELRLRTSAKSSAEFARNRQLLVFDRFLARVVAVLGDAATLKGGLVLERRLLKQNLEQPVLGRGGRRRREWALLVTRNYSAWVAPAATNVRFAPRDAWSIGAVISVMNGSLPSCDDHATHVSRTRNPSGNREAARRVS